MNVQEPSTKYRGDRELNSSLRSDTSKADQYIRIVTSALEVFSESTFQDATTSEIAKCARVSKRDIYAHFPDKHSLLLATVGQVLEDRNKYFLAALQKPTESMSLQGKLMVVGLALIDEIQSREMRVITRLVASETIRQPILGIVFFENGYPLRIRHICELLSMHAPGRTSPVSLENAADHFLALVSYEPNLSAMAGTDELWNNLRRRKHLTSAIECFRSAYPAFF